MSPTRPRAALFISICLSLVASAAKADHFSANWLEPNTGIWQQDGVWSTSAYPNNGHTIPGANGQPVPGPNPTYDVSISNASPCTLGIVARIQTINVFPGSTLNIGSSGYLWANTGFGNAGLITLNGINNFSGLLRASANSNVGSRWRDLHERQFREFCNGGGGRQDPHHLGRWQDSRRRARERLSRRRHQDVLPGREPRLDRGNAPEQSAARATD
jgi:hypothetical protein